MISKIKAAARPLRRTPGARQIASSRKLTCRKIAQWAINCVDARDSDAIMTPFEYDENPWDGWGCPMERDIKLIPLDGDPATNENDGEIIDWTSDARDERRPKYLRRSPRSPRSANQTRGIVWGAERPELLITEIDGLPRPPHRRHRRRPHAASASKTPASSRARPQGHHARSAAQAPRLALPRALQSLVARRPEAARDCSASSIARPPRRPRRPASSSAG